MILKKQQLLGFILMNRKLDLEVMKNWKNKLISGLTRGLKGLADKRNVTVVQGSAYFISANSLKIESDKGESLSILRAMYYRCWI